MTGNDMNVELLDLHPAQADLESLVRHGMQSRPRQLPAWLLYDSEGSKLFAAICEQPEYSLTRTEIGLLHQRADAIASAVGEGVLVEFGIGNARKVSPLLKALNSDLFVGLDISRDALRDALNGLSREHPQTTMLGICCDHSQLDALPQHPRLHGRRRIGFFPGSSLGNFSGEDAVALLQRFRLLLDGGPLLLGLEQPRDPALLEAAYDDAAGVSAAFARNLLTRLNRDLQGDIDPTRFRYRARWQSDASRIEMALVSEGAQTIRLAGEHWHFDADEAWITEHSVKYSPAAAELLAQRAGWSIKQRWHDADDHLSLHLLLPAD